MLNTSGDYMSGRAAGSTFVLRLVAASLLFVVVGFGVVTAEDCDQEPDLWAHDQIANPTEVVQGELVRVTVKVMNESCADVGPFEVAAYYTTDTGNTLIGTQQVVDGLPACEEIELTFIWDTTDVPPGTYPIEVCADSDNLIAEHDETDNCCTTPTEVTVNDPPPRIEASKAFSDANGGLVEPGDVIEYTITLRNVGTGDQGNNDGAEFLDEIPGRTTYVGGSATATSGTVDFDAFNNQIIWNGGIPAGDTVTISFEVTIGPDIPYEEIICNQGIVRWDSDKDGINDAQQPTDNPSTAATDDPTCLTIDPLPLPDIEAIKSSSCKDGRCPGPDGIIRYEIVITNQGTAAQADNPGHEFEDEIPAWTTYVNGSVNATSGAVGFKRFGWFSRLLNPENSRNRITWNGSIPAGESVTITFEVKIDSDVPSETVISNQGVVHWDSGGDGSNDLYEPTDDPDTPPEDDPTDCLLIREPPGDGGGDDPTPAPPTDQETPPTDAPPSVSAPALSEWGMITLIGLLGVAFGAMLLRRRRLLAGARR